PSPRRGGLHRPRHPWLCGRLLSYRYRSRLERLQGPGHAVDRHRGDGLSRQLLLPDPAWPAGACVSGRDGGVMGLLGRISVLLKKSTAVALATAPDPRVTHLTSHQKQRALLNQVIKAVAEVGSPKQRLRTAAQAV